MIDTGVEILFLLLTLINLHYMTLEDTVTRKCQMVVVAMKGGLHLTAISIIEVKPMKC